MPWNTALDLQTPGDTGYTIDNSMWFDGAADYMRNGNFETATSTQICTISFWMKLGRISGVDRTIFEAGSGATHIELVSGDTIRISLNSGQTLTTSAVFRDPHAFYHFVFAIDISQGTPADRCDMYINGVQVTNFSTDNRGSWSTLNFLQGSATVHHIGNSSGSNQWFEGQLSDFYAVDGQQLAATDFGEFNDDGNWVPKDYEGTYGNNGFHLDFADSSDLGHDANGTDTVFDHSGYTATAPLGGTANNAKDNDTGTVVTTTSTPSSGQVLIKYDCGSAQNVEGVRVVDYSQASTNAVSYRVEYSTDDAIWNTFGTSITVSPGDVDRSSWFDDAATSARYWRLVANQNHDANVTVADFLLLSSMGNNFDTYSISSANQVQDTPTQNLPVMSIIDSYSSSRNRIFEGASRYVRTSALSNQLAWKLSVPCFGKGYCEFLVNTIDGSNPANGPGYCLHTMLPGQDDRTGTDRVHLALHDSSSDLYLDASIYGSYPAIADSDIIGMAWDADAGKIWMSVNNTWIDDSGGTAGVPSTGSNPLKTFTDTFFISWIESNNAGTLDASLKILTADLTYSPPSGFSSFLDSIPNANIRDASKYFDVALYAGDGTDNRAVTGLNMTPDMSWVRSRGNNTNIMMVDSVRGVPSSISIEAEAAENDAGRSGWGTVEAFNAGSIQVGYGTGSTVTGVNNVLYDHIAWNWVESPTAGFDIVTYTGDNTSNRNISHNLGVAPEFALFKNRDTTDQFWLRHANMTAADYFIGVRNVRTQSNTNSPWGTGNWSATQFMVTNNATHNANESAEDYVAYLFASINGFSKIGFYDPYTTTDNSVVYCGFKPRFIIIKDLNSVPGELKCWDWAMTGYNPLTNYFAIDQVNGGELSGLTLDFLSTGFKIRYAGTNLGWTGHLYIYYAVAEHPYKTVGDVWGTAVA